MTRFATLVLSNHSDDYDIDVVAALFLSRFLVA